MENVKILFISHERELNGATKSLINLISQFEKRNKIYVLTAYNDGPFCDEMKKHKVQMLVYPYFWWLVPKNTSRFSILNPMLWLRHKLLWNLKENSINGKTADALAEFIKKERIQIVHTNTSVINIGALLKKRLGNAIKHIWHIREFGDADFDLYPIISRESFFSFMNENTDYFICISEKIRQHYAALSPEKKAVVYNGIGKENYITEHKTHTGIHFLIAGRIIETKGQREAVEACAALLKEGYRNFKLYLAGSGKVYFTVPKEYREHFVFLGQVKNMPALRKQMDVELVCSRAEAFGRVTAEAMMSGLPVIGSNTGGTPELIADGKVGFLYEYGNQRALAAKMKVFLDDPSLIRKMGAEAQKYALAHFTIERCAEEISRYY